MPRPALVLRAYEAILREAEQSPAFRMKVRRAAVRVNAQMGKWLDAQLPRQAASVQIDKVRSAIKDFSELVASTSTYTPQASA